MLALLPTVILAAALAAGASDLEALVREAEQLHSECAKLSGFPDGDTYRRVTKVLGELSKDGSQPAVDAIARFLDVPRLQRSAIQHLIGANSPPARKFLEKTLTTDEPDDDRRLSCVRAAIVTNSSALAEPFAPAILATALRTEKHALALSRMLQFASLRFSVAYARMAVEALQGPPWGRAIEKLTPEDRTLLFTTFLARGLAKLENEARMADASKAEVDPADETDGAKNDDGRTTAHDGTAKKPGAGSPSARERREEIKHILSGLTSTAADENQSAFSRTVCFLALAEQAHGPAADAARTVLERRGTKREPLDPALIGAAATLLAEVGDERARPRVHEQLKAWTRSSSKIDTHETTIVALLEAASALDVTEAGPIVTKLTRSRNLYVKTAAVSALALVGEGKAEKALRQALRQRAWQLRRAAIKGCRRLATRGAVDLLIDRMPNEKGRLRYDLLVALVELTGVSMPYEQADWKKWWEYSRERYEPPQERHVVTGRTVVVAPENPQSRYFGLEVISQQLAFIADVSGSMSAPLMYEGRLSTRIDMLQKQLLGLLDSLNKKTKLNVYFFDSAYSRVFPKLVSLTPRNHAVVRHFVSERKAAGGTNLYDPLESALLDSDVDTIYLLSDGQPGSGKHVTTEAILGAVRNLNRRRRIQINTISIGTDSPLMRALAKENEGSYRLIH